MPDALPTGENGANIIVKDDEVESCGLIMPIAEFDDCSVDHWSEVRQILTSAVDTIEEPRFKTKMVSDGEAAGIIQSRIVQNVYSDSIVVCDVSGRNPNVLFELGMRIAFDRPVVIVKDDATSFSFDITPLEHISYPRSLRHSAIEEFKTRVAAKVKATHAEWQNDARRPSYIKAFGPITTVRFEERTEAPDKAMLDLMKGMDRRLDALMHSALLANTGATIQVASLDAGMLKPHDFQKIVTGEGVDRSAPILSFLSENQISRLLTEFRQRKVDGKPADMRWMLTKMPRGLNGSPPVAQRLLAELSTLASLESRAGQPQ